MLPCLRDGREEAQDHQPAGREGLPTICWALAYPSLIPLPESNPAFVRYNSRVLQLASSLGLARQKLSRYAAIHAIRRTSATPYYCA